VRAVQAAPISPATFRARKATAGGCIDALHRGFAGLLGRLAGAHLLDDEEAAAAADDLFADARGPGGAGGVVDVEAGTDDRRIADAAGEFVGQAAGRADAAEFAVGIARQHRHGIVIIGIDGECYFFG
jgi:hypothetical protein